MFEAMYCGDETIEEKYLHNFSSEEKIAFRQRIEKSKEIMAKYQARVDTPIATDSSVVFNTTTIPHNALDIKYMLNRIAADDPRDTVFMLNRSDDIGRADQLAFHIANAFRTNTQCKRIVLNSIGLTDQGMLPLLNVLRHKELALLSIGGNDITEKSLLVLDTILADPETKWTHVRLGKVILGLDHAGLLMGHDNLSFIPIVRPFPRARSL